MSSTPEPIVATPYQRPAGREIGAFTFGELTADATGRLDPARRLTTFIDLAVLAEQAGRDVVGVGEHHRPDLAIASPPPWCSRRSPRRRRGSV